MVRYFRYVALALFLLIPCAARGQVTIASECRIKNRPPGRCGWCALETLGRHHHLKALYDLTEDHSSTCDADGLKDLLKEKKITYRAQEQGKQDRAILKYAVREHLGAVVGFRELKAGKGGHIVTLVDFTETSVKVIDSNDADGRTREMSLDRFLYWWDGFALVLEAKETKSPAKSKSAALVVQKVAAKK